MVRRNTQALQPDGHQEPSVVTNVQRTPRRGLRNWRQGSWDVGLSVRFPRFLRNVENVCPNSGFSFLVWKDPSFQFGADDHLPASHLCFASAPVIVVAVNLPCQAPLVSNLRDVFISARWITGSIEAENSRDRRRDCWELRSWCRISPPSRAGARV
jgi:hypothetical protein